MERQPAHFVLAGLLQTLLHEKVGHHNKRLPMHRRKLSRHPDAQRIMNQGKYLKENLGIVISELQLWNQKEIRKFIAIVHQVHLVLNILGELKIEESDRSSVLDTLSSLEDAALYRTREYRGVRDRVQDVKSAIKYGFGNSSAVELVVRQLHGLKIQINREKEQGDPEATSSVRFRDFEREHQRYFRAPIRAFILLEILNLIELTPVEASQVLDHLEEVREVIKSTDPNNAYKLDDAFKKRIRQLRKEFSL